ncbi:MFS general substrate transporter [Sistotremastrum niveocremeum HHB9708]|uniref:MFS general substrate transporter n=1 Tax=Sistotremastrum niveocremeum HHB9708 TaxID=1314777 RepID=A0A164T6A3_9AGAM|nr:MFS general substrate transporter [Sistotremastrum niveocremeum HHB9708]
MSRTSTTSSEASLRKAEDPEHASEKESGHLLASEVAVDGGLHGWLTVAGCWCIQFVTVGHLNSFGIYEDFYKEHYLDDSSSSAIAWIGGSQSALLFGMGIIVGPLFDKGRFHLLLIVSSILYILCNFMLSITTEHHFYQVFLSQGLGIGLAMGIMYVPSLGILSHYFAARRALATGIALTGSSIGGIVYPIMVNNLINRGGNHFGGGGTPATFRSGIKLNAALNSGLLVLANLLMKPKKPTQPSKGTTINAKEFLKEPDYILMILGTAMSVLGSFFPIIYVQLFSVTKGISADRSFYILSILHGASIFGRIFPSLLADHVGSLNTLIPVTFGLGATILGYLGVRDWAHDVITSSFAGFFFGGFNTLVVAATANLARHPGEVGARIGIAFSLATPCSLVGGPINGALLTGDFLWSRPIIFSGVCTIVGAGLFGCVRVVQIIGRRRSLWKSPAQSTTSGEYQ